MVTVTLENGETVDFYFPIEGGDSLIAAGILNSMEQDPECVFATVADLDWFVEGVRAQGVDVEVYEHHGDQ